MVYQENTNTKSVFGIPVLNFLVFYWYFIGILNTIYVNLVKYWYFLGRIKIGLVFGFCGCNFIGIGLVSVCNFPENGISNIDVLSILKQHRCITNTLSVSMLYRYLKVIDVLIQYLHIDIVTSAITYPY